MEGGLSFPNLRGIRTGLSNRCVLTARSCTEHPRGLNGHENRLTPDRGPCSFLGRERSRYRARLGIPTRHSGPPNHRGHDAATQLPINARRPMSYKPVLEAIERIETLAELRGILKFLAQTKTTTSYVPLAAALGKFSGGSLLATMLGSIQTEDSSQKKPMTSSLVIGAKTGIPGNGYFSNARTLGSRIPKDPAEEFLFWADQMKQLGVQLPQSSIDQATSLGLLPPSSEGQQTLEPGDFCVREVNGTRTWYRKAYSQACPDGKFMPIL